MTGACQAVSQVQAIPWSAAPSPASVLRWSSAFVTPIVTRRIAPKPEDSWAAAVEGAPVSFWRKRRAKGWRNTLAEQVHAAGLKG